VIVSCGSGVTACHDALAIELAGLPPARLYVGSFSGWIEDPDRPVATGPEPG
jgi:thiosulfate/3-mercaptopyruvate sulfurtransferase